MLSVYLLSLTELHQLAKLPALVEHYAEHKEKNTSLSLWEFLCIHYSKSDPKDSDYAKDMELPFKSHDGCTNLVLIAFVSGGTEDISTKPIHTANIGYSVYGDEFFSSAYLSSIWQPPKMC